MNYICVEVLEDNGFQIMTDDAAGLIATKRCCNMTFCYLIYYHQLRVFETGTTVMNVNTIELLNNLINKYNEATASAALPHNEPGRNKAVKRSVTD